MFYYYDLFKPLLLLLLLLLVVRVVTGEIRLNDFEFANVKTYVLTDTTYIDPRSLMVFELDGEMVTIAAPPDAKATQAICKASASIEVPLIPKMCSDSLNPSESVDATFNCAPDDQTAAQNMIILDTTFAMEAGSSACQANGGDETSCFGPLHLVMPNKNLPIDNRDITPQNLLDAYQVVLITGFGPRCEGPLVTTLDLVLPILRLNTTTCQDSFNASFGGDFRPFYFDDVEPWRQNEDGSVNDTKIYARINTATHQRISLQRYDDVSIGRYRVTLYQAAGDGKKLHTSLDIVGADWLVNNTLLLDFDSGCSATLTVEDVTNGTFMLNRPKQLDDLNFAMNQNPDLYYVSRECNRHVGVRDANLQLKFPHTNEAELGGGEFVFKSQRLAGEPIQIDPNSEFAEYDIDNCDSFYPPAIEFQAYGLNGTGDLIPPYIADTGICYAPFLEIQRIQNMESNVGLSTDARYLDCFKQGGYVYGTTRQFCFRPIEKQVCKRGWIYYHQYCYYKFDADKETKYKTVDVYGDDVCKQINPFAQTIKRMTDDVYLFLRRFVFWKRQPGHPYRVNLGGKRCVGFDIQTNTSSVDMGYEDDIELVYDMSCETKPAFPVCRYHIKDIQLPYSTVSLSPSTITTLGKGQPGVPHNGHEITCKCYPGWAGVGCTNPTCPPIPLLGNDTVTKFFAKCYANGRGSCKDRNPRFCECFEGYGPSASWVSEHSDHPCACPSVTNVDPLSPTINGYIINEVFYPSTTMAVCGGRGKGQCTVEKSLNYGYCTCDQRTNMDPDALIKREPAYDGGGCNTPIAMIPANQHQTDGDVLERFCNGRGTVCPTGERYDQQRLDETYFTSMGAPVCRNRDGSLKNGCVCDDGWAGPTCTCPVPKNVLDPLLYPVYDSFLANQAYAALKVRGFVVKVENQDDKTCSLTRVWVQDKPSSQTYECTPVDNKRLTWTCPSQIAVTKVFIESTDSDVLYCSIKAFGEDHPPCGNHPLPWAGAFYRNEEYRGYFKYELPQSTKFAPHGCQYSSCMCMSGYTGQKCSYGISAMRYDWDMEGFHSEVCGSTTFPRRGFPLPDGKGCQCYKVEGLFREARFVGDACEGVEINTNGTWLECAGRGTIIKAKFPIGVCEYDQLDLEADPLNTPFFGLNPGVEGQHSFVFTVQPHYRNETTTVGTGTIVWIDGAYWQFPPLTRFIGHSMYLPNNESTTTFCDQKVRIPVNITYGCDDAAVLTPRQVNVFGEFWSVTYICLDGGSDWENPACYETTKTVLQLNPAIQYSYCPSSWSTQIDYEQADYFDWEFECLHHTTDWVVHPRYVDMALESGFYQDVFLHCGSLSTPAAVDYTKLSFSNGNLDCSNPIDRVISDTAYALGYTPVRQCDSLAMKDHADVKGWWYGLFEGFIPGLNFPHDREWTKNETQFIASLLGGEICYPTADEAAYVHEAFDGRTLDAISTTWVADIPIEAEDVLSDTFNLTGPLPLYQFTNLSNWLSYRTVQFGNPWSHDSMALNHTIFRPDERPGYMVRIPLNQGQFVRKLQLTIPFTGGEAFQVVGPSGVLCQTLIKHTLPINTTLDVVCSDGDKNGFLPQENEWDTLLRLAQLGLPNTTRANELIANYYGNTPFQWITVLWSHENWPLAQDTFSWENIKLYSRNVSYNGLFESLKRSILIDNVFPPHTIYRQSCLQQPGRSLRPLNVTRDIGYLRSIHLTHLAQRRCSNTFQCKKFARNAEHYQCVFNMDYAEPWTAGDAEQTHTFIGTEGGCQCHTGYSTSKEHCATCVHGYGPVDNMGWVRYREFNALANVTDLVSRTFCQLPIDPTSLRDNKICGGVGDVIHDRYEVNATMRVFKPTNETRRCLELIWNGTETFSLLDGADDYELKFIRYRSTSNNRYLTVIGRDEIYLDHTTRLQQDEISLDGRTLSFTNVNATLECVPLDNSKTHGMKLLGGLVNRIVDSSQSFFLSKVIYVH